MGFFCEVCLKEIKTKNKYKHFKSKSQQEFDKCKHMQLSHEDIDKDHIDEAFYLYIIEHNKKFEYYIIKWEFKLVLNVYQFCPYVMSNESDNKTTISWKIFFDECD